MNKTIECRADLCGREAHLEGEDWYFCKCGWSGGSYDEVAVLAAEVKRLRNGLLLILGDFETKKTDMYEMRNRIETILKGDD